MKVDNFGEFIKKDIDAKKTLITTLPLKNKTQKKKYNETIKEIEGKYDEYYDYVKKYLSAKARSIKVTSSKEDNESLVSRIEELERLKFLLNPTNSYIEKMGFDTLIYQINNYYRFNFKSLNEIINGFLDKFELAGIHLTSDDFDYTCYVHEYMASYLDVRNKKLSSYERVSEIFEQIYWVNPEIISHIELNFRKLIRNNAKKFNAYISRLQTEAMVKSGIVNYGVCLEKLQAAYIQFNIDNKEDIAEIVNLAKEGKFDINQYLPDSKVRKQAYISLIPADVNLDDKEEINKICSYLEKLKANVEEYKNYVEFKPLFDFFKTEFEPLIKEVNKKGGYKGLNIILDKIIQKEKDLDNLNKKIFTGKRGIFDYKDANNIKKLKIDSVYTAKELFELYKTYDKEYYKEKVVKIISNTLTVADVLNFYYSFDFYKKVVIQKVYNIETYDEVVKTSENFDLFAKNPTNLIINGVLLFDESNIPRIICNKYRLNNIILKEEDLVPEILSLLLNKIVLILRVNKIENSNISLTQIWFLTNVKKLINK